MLLPTPSSEEDDVLEVTSRRLALEGRGRDTEQEEDGYREIPRTGLEFFEYRRALFLSGTLPSQFPEYIPDRSLRIPTTLPEPLQLKQSTCNPDSAVGRLEKLMGASPRGEETDQAWNAGIENVFRQLNAGRKLAGGVQLGLVIKILRASWIQDGTWPKDPRTKRAFLPPPDSPRPLEPQISYPPRPCSPLDTHRHTLKRPTAGERTVSGGPASLLDRMARLEERADLSGDE